MAGYYGSKEFIGWDPAKNQTYLKSEVMDELRKNPSFTSVFRSARDERIIFETMQKEADLGKKKLTNEGMLRAIGTAHVAGIVSASRVKPLVRGLFPGISIPTHVQQELVFGAGDSEEPEATKPESEPSESSISGSEAADGGETTEAKRPKSILEILGF